MGRSCARPGRLCAVDTRSVRARSSKGDTVRGLSWRDEEGGRQRALSIHSGMIDRVLGLNLQGWKLKRSLKRRTRECTPLHLPERWALGSKRRSVSRSECYRAKGACELEGRQICQAHVFKTAKIENNRFNSKA